MKQVLQNLKTGVIEVADVPGPDVRPGCVLVGTRSSLISIGTERMLVEFGRASLLQKARQQPDKVKQVLEKMEADGVLPTLEAVFSRLDAPLPLGYCNTGVVQKVGEGVGELKVGDRVVCNGPHAEMVCVPRNLCAAVPDGVDDDVAPFAVLGAVALQGIRLLAPTLGESVAVIGLGLVGLIAVQLLRANGCRVLGMDIDEEKTRLARELGVEACSTSGREAVRAGSAFTKGVGVDAVLLTASTKSSDVIHQAAQMSRKRGRIVLVGVVGLELSRADFYEKELSFQVSCSYGPGRYDPLYEQKGLDYPIGFVRWTAQRNFEAVLEMIASGKLNVKPLISDRIPHTRAAEAYERLVRQRGSLGILLNYPEQVQEPSRIVRVSTSRSSKGVGGCVAGVIGAGGFARSTLLPALYRQNARLKGIASATGVSAAHAAKKFRFEFATTDYTKLLSDPDINTVFVVSPHHLHASMVVEALRAGKHVYVEKPLAINADELAAIRSAYEDAKELQLMVGFNRRFAPHCRKMKELLAERSEPIVLVMVVNAGLVPRDHWVHDPAVGGGRIIGEACHFIDLLAFLAGDRIKVVCASAIGGSTAEGPAGDTVTINLSFGDGSIGTVHYLTSGNRRFPKETIEVFSEGRVLALQNFRRMRGYGWSGFSRMHLWRQDKGHRAAIRAFVQGVASGGVSLIPFDELENTALATFAAVESVRSGNPIHLHLEANAPAHRAGQ